ncbi:MAG: LysR substrate-binding domain-containing protein [Maricaulaceae bacterium]
MNLRDLDYICAVANTGHFGRAAEICHVSQPTLSGQIKKLEDYLGVPLFERARTGAKLTDVGRDIVAVARAIQTDVKRIKLLADTHKDPFSGTMSLGIIPTLAPNIIPLFVPNMATAFPRLSSQFEEDQTPRLTERLVGGSLDIALLATPPEHDALIQVPIFSEPFWLAYPNGHAIGTLDTLTLADLNVDDLMMLSEGHCLRDQVLELCSVTGRPDHGLKAASLDTLIKLTAATQAMTLVPALAVKPESFSALGLSVRPIDDAAASRIVSLTFRSSLPRKDLVDGVAKLIVSNLPESVTPLYRI